MINRNTAKAMRRSVIVCRPLRNVGVRPGNGSPHFAQIFALAEISPLQRGHVPVNFREPPRYGQFAVSITQLNTVLGKDFDMQTFVLPYHPVIGVSRRQAAI
jgi:hypothetical protein